MAGATSYDVLIVGGGLVGASLACALADTPLRIGVIEAHPFNSERQPSYDDRSIALAHGSQRIFASMGVWPAVHMLATPIRHIHISNRGHFGFARLHHHEVGVDALGYVVENRALGPVLGSRLARASNITLHCPAQVENVTTTADAVTVTARSGAGSVALTAALVVAADGHDSVVRERLGLPVQSAAYDQVAIIANVTPEHFHNYVAYERFTDSGPLALLPLGHDRCSLVWTVRPDQVDEHMAWDDATFAAQLQARFGHRLGRFVKVGKRASYPLTLARVKHPAAQRVALIGNAAHTLHPVAGQGFNLGLRDVAVLAQVIVDAQRAGTDVGASSVLADYLAWRARDHERVITFTDGLARVFANPWPPIMLARNAALCAIDVLPPVKRALMRLTMGLAGKQPRLARGLEL